MCLETEVSKVRKGKGTGYKIYNKIYHRSLTKKQYDGYYHVAAYQCGKWYKAEELEENGAMQMSAKYKYGFHIYVTLHGACQENGYNGSIVKVAYRKAHTKGKSGNGHVCVVANEVKLLEEVI